MGGINRESCRGPGPDSETPGRKFVCSSQVTRLFTSGPKKRSKPRRNVLPALNPFPFFGIRTSFLFVQTLGDSKLLGLGRVRSSRVLPSRSGGRVRLHPTWSLGSGPTVPSPGPILRVGGSVLRGVGAPSCLLLHTRSGNRRTRGGGTSTGLPGADRGPLVPPDSTSSVLSVQGIT